MLPIFSTEEMSNRAAPFFQVRKARPGDAEQMILLLQDIAIARIYTAISEPWSAAEQERHVAGLSAREAILIAEDQNNLIGYQVLELWAPSLAAMAHVGQVGTFIKAGWRGQGVGSSLFRHTIEFARAHAYGKFVVQVRSSNMAGQSFYKRLGFNECGRLTRQVRIGSDEDDEILMEYFL
jgi:ribosomal protein S18 acetylase RimI-like enzyme